jgi:hypothetical protein
MTLNGITVAQFNTAAQTAFIAALAAQLSVSTSAVAITGMSAVGSAGRHLLQTGVVVAFTVTTASPAAAAAVSSGITTASTSSSFLATLNTQLMAAGAPAATSLTVSGPLTVAAPTSAAPARAALSATALTAAVLVAALL